MDRLAALSLPQGRFGLDTIRALLAELGDPHWSLPPVFHVAGTNGKGSTCAFLRAALEAEGLRVHVFTSPHLVRYNERIRIAGELVSDTLLAELLREALDAADAAGLAPSFFEVTTAAAFLAFAREPADACVIEVGLGGRFDATNVLDRVAASGIASLGIDHEAFLLAPEDGAPEMPLARIAFEKAGIVRPGSPLVTLAYPPEATSEIERAARVVGTPLHMRGQGWDVSAGAVLEYRDRHGALTLPLPALPGAHQAANAGLAVAMLRHQDRVTVTTDALAAAMARVEWPARLQLLEAGPLRDAAGDRPVWLDGGHNPDAGAAIARHFAGQRLHLVLGMLANKDPAALVVPLGDTVASLQIVDVPGHEAHGADAFGDDANAAASIDEALRGLPDDGLPVLIAGSLYLAGDVLRRNGQNPA